MRLLPSIAICCGASLLTGCSRQEPQFSHRADFAALAPAAQVQVDATLAEHFGGPVNMVAWEKLPVHYSGAVGRVVTVEADGARLTVSLDDEARPIEAGQTLQWLTGALAGDSPDAGAVAGTGAATPALASVAAYDADSHVLTFAEPLPAAPAAGDRFAVGPGAVLEHGRLLYAEHCQHCHGVAGDGQGPTARYLNPRPRDYRLGKFKFTSTQSSNRASRTDLATIISEGIPGTYMPSFKLLEPEEAQAIVEYVMWLSMRGESEYKLVTYFKDLTEAEEIKEYIEEDFPDEFSEDADFMATQWKTAQEPTAQVIPKQGRTPTDAASIARGRALYLSDKAKCASCHGESGRGDGPQTLAVQKNAQGDSYDIPGLFDDWGNSLKPRDLRTGMYRGGRRPVDLYRRVYAGIKGTPMPAFGTALTDAEIWDIVNYVMAIPFEEHTPGDGATSPPPVTATASAN